jgi:signal transduction histidine kinase
LVRDLAQAHGGRAEIEEGDDGGALVLVHFPVA